MKKLLFIFLAFVNIYASEAFIKPSTLKDSLDNKDLVVVDVSESYKKSHIIGAVSLNVRTLLQEAPSTTLASKEELEDIFRSLGISTGSKVVIYGRNTQKDIKNSAFLAFVLIAHGFENVSILDGGYMGWVFDYDWFTTREEIEPQEGDLKLIDTNTSINLHDLHKNGSILVDTRDPQAYYGIEKNSDDRTIGHIPKAKNSYFAYKFLKDKTLRSLEDLEKIYADGLKLKKKDEIIVYGNNCFDASVEWYIIYHKLGYKNAKLYYNGFSEYIDSKEETERFKWE